MNKNYPPPTLLSHLAPIKIGVFKSSAFILMMFVTLIASKTTLSAQTQAALLFESATQQGVQEAFYKNNITKSANNFIYTAGASLNASGNYDIIVTKHSQANVEIWTQVWANANYDGLDMAADLAIDSNGDVTAVGANCNSNRLKISKNKMSTCSNITVREHSCGVRR